MDSENRDLRRPVTLAVAAEVLAERYPEYAFTFLGGTVAPLPPFVNRNSYFLLSLWRI